MLNFPTKSRFSECAECDFSPCCNGFCLDHQFIRQFQGCFHMGDNMVLRPHYQCEKHFGFLWHLDPIATSLFQRYLISLWLWIAASMRCQKWLLHNGTGMRLPKPPSHKSTVFETFLVQQWQASDLLSNSETHNLDPLDVLLRCVCLAVLVFR